MPVKVKTAAHCAATQEGGGDNMATRALARIRYRGKEYFLDDRLWELRPVNEPWVSIPLQTDEAARIISEGKYVGQARFLN
jgi:hypothetical protein